MVSITLIQSHKHGIFGTTLMLGWDSPTYVWLAKYVLNKGPIHMMQAWSFPHFYTQLLAFFGYLCGNIVLVERILPLTFCILLICTNSKIMLNISKNVYLASLTAFLTVFSVNVLRVFSDLNRSFMASSFAFVAFLLVPNLEHERSILNKKYLFFILILFVIASTQFETYFVLALSLFLHGLTSRKWRKFFILILASAMPIIVLVSLFPAYFFGYANTVVIFHQELTFHDIILWNSGSWLLLGFLILGSYLFYKSRMQNGALVSLVYSWSFVNLLIVVLIGPFSREFALRSMYIMPIPLLLALAILGYKTYLIRWRLKLTRSLNRKGHLVKINLNQVLLILIVFCVMAGSIFTVIQNAEGFLTPFISYSKYEKIVKAKEYFTNHDLSMPIVVFGGYPNFGLVNLYRNYIGAEIGEHFAYYGEISNLFRLLPSRPRVNSTTDPYASQLERHYLTYYYYELIGNVTGPSPPMYHHDLHVTNETLMSYPILIVTPDFYTEEIPHYIKPFYIGDGIYVIPPNSINPSEIT